MNHLNSTLGCISVLDTKDASIFIIHATITLKLLILCSW